MNLRKTIKDSDRQPYRTIRKFYYFMRRFSLPAPKIVWRPIWHLVHHVRNLFYWIYRVFWVTPVFKGLCEKTGKHFSAGTFLPFVIGNGRIFLGDKVSFHGKVDFVFGSIKDEIPEIHIGNNTGIGHNVRFDIAGKIVIGNNCLIAKDVAFHDASGHHIDPDLRKAKVPIGEKQIRPISIGNNVWIGDGAYISPGTVIGDDSVVSAMTMAGRRIPPRSLVYSTPAKVIKIRKISNMI